MLKSIDDTAHNSRWRLDNFNHTHLVPASGKLVLQKRKKDVSLCNFRALALLTFIFSAAILL